LRYKRGTGKIEINIFHNEAEDLVCIIQDNGIGREKARLVQNGMISINKSTGLQSNKERVLVANRIYHANIQLMIEDLYNENRIGIGTCVTLIIPQVHSKFMTNESIHSYNYC